MITKDELRALLRERGVLTHFSERIINRRGDGSSQTYVFLRRSGGQTKKYLGAWNKLELMEHEALQALIETKIAQLPKSKDDQTLEEGMAYHRAYDEREQLL